MTEHTLPVCRPPESYTRARNDPSTGAAAGSVYKQKDLTDYTTLKVKQKDLTDYTSLKVKPEDKQKDLTDDTILKVKPEPEQKWRSGQWYFNAACSGLLRNW